MPGLAVDGAKEDIGYVRSSSIPTLAGAEARPDEVKTLATMAISAAPGKDRYLNEIISTRPSANQVNDDALSSYQVSSPTPLHEFPTDHDISPFSTPPVLLRVGGASSPSRETEPVSFFVHEKLLTKASAFFRAALGLRSSSSNHSSSKNSSGYRIKNSSSGDPNHAGYSFLEAQTRTIDLPEDRPDDVRFFLKWLYSGVGAGIFPPKPSHTPTSLEKNAAPSSAGKPTSPCPTTKQNTLLPHTTLHSPLTTRSIRLHSAYKRERALLSAAARHGDITPLLPPRPPPPAFGPLIRLYIFADKYQVGLGLRDLICDVVGQMAQRCNAVPGCGDVATLWEGLPEEEEAEVLTGLKSLVVDMYVGMKTEGLLQGQGQGRGQGWHELFLKDLVGALKREGLLARKRTVGGRNGEGDRDRDGERERQGSLRLGTLRRNTCDYHDHHHHQ